MGSIGVAVVALGLTGLGLLRWLRDIVLLWPLWDVEHSLSLELAGYLCVGLWFSQLYSIDRRHWFKSHSLVNAIYELLIVFNLYHQFTDPCLVKEYLA